MNISQRTLLKLIVLLTCTMPFSVYAHALPVDTSPSASSVLEQSPSDVQIQFSERIDLSASSIVVRSPSGTVVSSGSLQLSADRKTLRTTTASKEQGTYIVSWSAVSADDGHFTKGAYPFAVGKGAVIGAQDSSTAEVVEIATVPEALAMTVELLGHGLLWAALLLFAFVFRPLLNTGRFESESRTVHRVYEWPIYSGALLVFLGGSLQLVIKSVELAGLRTTSFLDSLHIYIGTAAGSATVVRLCAVLVFVTLFTIAKKRLFDSKRFTFYEYALVGCLCIFAYFRAKISHATSNPFHPDFSIAVNFFHVIEKDIWAGILVILLVLCIIPRLRGVLEASMSRMFAMLAVDFGAVSVTACYIVWLHLKSFSNIYTTQWGAAFLELLITATLLVAFRLYHTIARIWWPQIFSRGLFITLAAECALAVFVVYFSSVVIITSPPLALPPTPTLSASDQGVSMQIAKDSLEEGVLLLSLHGQHVSSTTQPIVTIEDTSLSVGPVSVHLLQKYPGAYAVPEGLVSGQGPFIISITAQQDGAYDAHGLFTIQKNTFSIAADWESHRAFDLFAGVFIVIALSVLLISIILFRASMREAQTMFAYKSNFRLFVIVGSFLVVAFCMTAFIGIVRTSGIENPFRHLCESDGNMWHLMQPTRAGNPLSRVPVEGCMWGMGTFIYMFPNKSEYEYKSSLPHAVVTLNHDRASIVAGVPTTLSIKLTEPDGSPATLFVDMEKLIHVVIVSKDQTVFAHIHPDDIHPLTKEQVDTSTFAVQYTFPKAGQYLVSVDYAHGLTLESKQFVVDVAGYPTQTADQKIHPSPGVFDGYSVSLDYFQPYVGEVTTLKYTITKDGNPVTDVVPYLSAAMHVSVVKNDLSIFIHTHGEVHPAGTAYPPIIIKNGQVVHSMAMMVVPSTFGPLIETHVIFPSRGLYTVWGEFKVENKIIPTSFSIRVE